jgi:hypothetical protein
VHGPTGVFWANLTLCSLQLSNRITELGKDLTDVASRPQTAADPEMMTEIGALRTKIDNNTEQISTHNKVIHEEMRVRFGDMQRELRELSGTLPGKVAAVNDGLENIRRNMDGKADNEMLSQLQVRATTWRL